MRGKVVARVEGMLGWRLAGVEGEVADTFRHHHVKEVLVREMRDGRSALRAVGVEAGY